MIATALIADDEPLLRQRLAALLDGLWPGLRVVASARNGAEALQLFEEHRPQVASIRELASELDPRRFVQVHRSAIVCLERVSHFVHGDGDSGELHLKGRSDRVPVSRSYQNFFQAL